MLCSLIDRYQHFETVCYIHLYGKKGYPEDGGRRFLYSIVPNLSYCKALQNLNIRHVWYEVLMAVTMKGGAFWVVTPCSSEREREPFSLMHASAIFLLGLLFNSED
jgi:hypothetical protein